ncbi:T9SS type A sorting domain-containing protein [Tenacibaculum aestuariivivum]|uniref:T9SS type A sorting domain-containing protein n=1 Tax=Tenacibaculum aestuariivivum TaxID=2006131 RepID=UPI003AB163E8
MVSKGNTNIKNQGITTTTWEKISNYGCHVSFNGSNFRAMAYGTCLNFNIQAKITATNACGTTTIYRQISPDKPLPCHNNYSSYQNLSGSINNEGIRGIIFPDCGDNRRGARGINNETENTIISISDYYGQNLYSKTQRGVNFDTRKLRKGFYIVRYQTNTGYIYSKKLIVN